MTEFNWEKAVDDNFDATTGRRYIDTVGTHYLKLVGYDWYDGSYDEKTKRGFKQTVGPLFIFECEASETVPTGEKMSRMIALNRVSSPPHPEKTALIRKFAIAETRDIWSALLKTKDPESTEELTPDAMRAIMPSVDGVLETFAGLTIRCDARASKTPGFVNCNWYADDRTDG
jgi:hypothetical protein